MSGLNIDVSNGTCYTAAGKKLGAGFIPCGNSAFGYQTCCGAGDNCLADLACFGVHGSGYGSFLTYFAGCTDPNYKDASCPKKEVDQPWVALTLCDNSDGAWAICSQQGNPSTLQPGSFCSCTNSASATVAFKDSTSLANLAALPQSTGQTISFFAGHSPNTAATPTAGSSSSGLVPVTTKGSGTANPISIATSISTLPGGSVTTVYLTVTGSSPSQTGSSGGTGAKLGTGTIAGIAIGAVVAILLMIVLAYLVLLRRRQRARFESDSDAGAMPSKQRESDLSTTAPSMLARPATPSTPEVDGMPVSEIMGRPAAPWELRSELDGKQVAPGRRRVHPDNMRWDEAARKESEALLPAVELPGSEPAPKRNAAARPLEDAMVAPLRLRPRNQGG